MIKVYITFYYDDRNMIAMSLRFPLCVNIHHFYNLKKRCASENDIVKNAIIKNVIMKNDIVFMILILLRVFLTLVLICIMTFFTLEFFKMAIFHDDNF